jgi:predicted site-specific integrase-resolvase
VLKKLSQYAEEHAVVYRTAWNRFHKGKIPNAFMDEDGHIYVSDKPLTKQNKVAIYTRVSSNENKNNLDGQADRLKRYAEAKGYQIIHVVKEVGSGINDGRKKLEKLLFQKDGDILLVEHRDRLARIGTKYIELMLTKEERTLEVVNVAEDDKTDIVQDFVSMIYSFSAKLYGLRRSKRKTEKILSVIEEIKNEPEIKETNDGANNQD